MLEHVELKTSGNLLQDNSTLSSINDKHRFFILNLCVLKWAERFKWVENIEAALIPISIRFKVKRLYCRVY